MKPLTPAFLALLILCSCGSKDELVEDEPMEGAPEEEQSTAPRLLVPPVPVYQQQPMTENPFRVPEVTEELPEERSVLSRPVNTGDSTGSPAGE